MTSPEWSDEHVSRANRFVAYVVFAWLALVTLELAFSRTGTLGFLFVGVAVLGATWLLVHSLFTEVDGLVKTRLEEAGALEAGRDGDEADEEGGTDEADEADGTDASDGDGASSSD